MSTFLALLAGFSSSFSVGCAGRGSSPLADDGSRRIELAGPGSDEHSLALERPHNVIVIVMDDVGPELIGVYETLFSAQGKPGARAAATPAIDGMLAARGLTFTRAWSQPSCSPTRAGLLTGRHAFRNGVGVVTGARPGAGRNGLTSSAILLPEVLRSAPRPYVSVALGKWHLADTRQVAEEPTHPLGKPIGRWFERWAGTYFVATVPKNQSEREFGYRLWKKSFASAIESGVDPCAPGSVPCNVRMVAPPLENYATVDTADDAITVIGELREPYFLYVSFNACHKPLHDVPDELPRPKCPEYVAAEAPREYANIPANAARARRMMEALDAQIGRILCAVDESDTTVILLGDNGTAREATFPPYRARHAKGSLYEGGVHVPFIVRSPWIAPELVGTSSAALVHTTDVFATVCELAGVQASEMPTVDSISFAPCLRDPKAAPRGLLYSEKFEPNFVPRSTDAAPPDDYVARNHEQALSDGRYKLIRRWRRDANDGAIQHRDEFFDLVDGGDVDGALAAPRADYFEEHELLSTDRVDEQAAAALERLRRELDRAYPTLVH